LKRKLYLVLLLLTWLGLSGRLVYEHYFQSSRSGKYISLETGLQALPSESEWMNIFHNGHKMGYTITTISNQGANGYNISSTTNINVVFGGLASEIYLENTSRIDTLFRLEGFSYRMISEQYATHILGDKHGTTMQLMIIQGQDTARTEIEVPEDLYTYTAIQPMIASRGIVAGETIKVPAYDPMSNALSDVIITHEGQELQEVDGQKLLLNKLRIDFKGIPSILWLDDNGLTYREETLMGMTMERTTPESALKKVRAAEFDLLNGFAVTPSHPISRPEKLKELVLEVEGLPLASLKGLSSRRQTIIKTAPLTLRLQPAATPVDPQSVAVNLQANKMIQSDHPQIKTQVQRIVKPGQTTAAISERLTQWVFGYLEKRPVASISGAVDILNKGVGDCTEHTTLYTALSRAAGVPTKIHVGLVYVQGRFLFHAWPVVDIEGQWVDVDPSLNQFPADATHIALLEGDFQNLTALIPALGKVQIKVLEQSY